MMAASEVPAALPRARKSLSALNDPSNMHLVQPSLVRSESDDVTARGLATNPINKSKEAIKRRAMSIGGNAIAAGVTDPALKALSPRSFRRVAKPRKSILKITSAHSPRRSPNSPSNSQRRNLPRTNATLQTTPSKRLPGVTSTAMTSSPLAGGVDRYAHTIDFSGSRPNMLFSNTNSAGGQDNDDDDDFEDIPSHNNDLTLPASLHPRSRMSFAGTNSSAAAGSTAGMTDKEKTKAARRAFLASRKSVSFAPHAHVRMFDTVVSATPVNNSTMLSAAAAAAAASTQAQADSANKGFDFGKLGGQQDGEEPTQSKRGSSRRHGRQSSITSIGELPALVQPKANPFEEENSAQQAQPERQSGRGSKRRSVMEVGDESAMSMDIETDSESDQETQKEVDGDDSEEEEEDMDIEGQTMDFTSTSAVAFDEPTTMSIFSTTSVAPAPIEMPRFSVRRDLAQGSRQGAYSAFSSDLALDGQPQREDAAGDNDHTGASSIFTSNIVSASPAKKMRGRLSIGDDVTVDMDITEIVAGMGTLRPTGSPASTVSARSDDEDEDSEDDEDDDDEDEEPQNGGKNGPEERTMDFTVAVGGIIPGLPPVNAWRSAVSIGYTTELPDGYDPAAGHTMGSIFSSSSSSPLRVTSGVNNPFGTASTASEDGRVFTLPVMASNGDDSLEMDETIAVGGILTREDQTISSVDDEELPPREPTLSFKRNEESTGFGMFGFGGADNIDGEEGMDFTIAQGGILNQQDEAIPEPASNIFSLGVGSSDASRAASPSAGPSSGRAVATAVPDASVLAARQDPFGASPSPPRMAGASTENNPVGRNVEVAKEVAKKLVFTPAKSVTPRKVSPAKRSFEADLQQGDATKSRRTDAAGDKENVPVGSASSSTSPVKSSVRASGPRTPNKRLSVFGAPEKSPHKHLAPRSPARAMMTSPTKVNRPTTPSRLSQTETVEQPAWAQEEYSNIPLADFLEMAGIQFMTSMPTATRRKSVLNGGMPAEYMQRMMAGEAGDYPLHEYAAGMNAWFYYKMYHWACQQMEQDIEKSQVTLDYQFRDASVDNPVVVREYLAADEEEKGLFEAMLQSLKTNARLLAKEKWYDWRLQLTIGVQKQIEAMNLSLKEDKERIDAIRRDAQDSLPHLRERRMALEKALALEKMSIDAVTECDQVELKDLRTAIGEQGAQIAAFTAELDEQTEKLEQLRKGVEEHQIQKQEISLALAAARRECEQRKGFTKSEAFGFEQEFKALQNFNSWRLDKLTSTGIELVYDEEIRLTASCSDSQPCSGSASIVLLSKADQDVSATQGLFDLVKPVVEKAKTTSTFQGLVQLVARLWTAAQRLRAEFRLMGLQYPTKYSYVEATKTFVCHSTVLLTGSRSKIQVAFSVDEDMLVTWPESVSQVGIAVTKVYGPVDIDVLNKEIKEDIRGATAAAHLLAFSSCCANLERY